MNNKEFGHIIRVKRIEKKMRLWHLSEKIGIHQNYIGDLERGNKNPNLNTILKILDGLDLKIEIVEK